MTKTLPSSVHHHTPTLSVLDNRGQAIRSIAYQREQSAGSLDERISRTTYTALGTVETQTDARFFTEHPSAASAVNNFRDGSSLSGKVLHTTSVDAGEVETLFDIESRPCWSTDSRTTTTQYEYDTLGRPTTVTEQHDNYVAVTERLIYADNATASSSQNLAVSDGHNTLGQLIYHLDPAGVVKTDSFSLAGKPLAQTRQLLANDDIQVNWPAFKNLEELQELFSTPYYRTQWQQNATGEMGAQWDAKGNRQRLSYTVAGQLNSSYLTQFKQASEQAIVSRIHYSAAGQVLEETAGNGTVTTYTYETKTQRLIQLKSTRPSKTGRPTVLQDLRYCYDPVGNIVTIDDAAQKTQYFANQEVSAQRQYTYDTLYQLITATGREDAKAGVQTQALPPLKTPLSQAADGQLAAYTRFYQYDRGGNLIQIKHISAEQYTRTIEIAERSNRAAFILNEANGHLVEKEAQSFDGQGNLLALSTGQTLHWNPRNQLSQAIMIERAEGSPDDEEHYLYGSDRMRVSKTTTTQGASGLQRDNVIYLPGLELRKQNNGKEELDVILMGEAGRCQVCVLHWENGKPESIENDQLRYSIGDQIGSSLIELDADADKLSEEVYYPYGGTALWTAKSKVEAKYKYVRYSGKERDATGLYYYGYRYYMPWIGRWLNPDPAGTVDGLNLFRMVRGNPINFQDFQGMEPKNIQDIPLIALYGISQFRKNSLALALKQSKNPVTIDEYNEGLGITNDLTLKKYFEISKTLKSGNTIQIEQQAIDSYSEKYTEISPNFPLSVAAEQQGKFTKSWAVHLMENAKYVDIQSKVSSLFKNSNRNFFVSYFKDADFTKVDQFIYKNTSKGSRSLEEQRNILKKFSTASSYQELQSGLEEKQMLWLKDLISTAFFRKTSKLGMEWLLNFTSEFNFISTDFNEEHIAIEQLKSEQPWKNLKHREEFYSEPITYSEIRHAYRKNLTDKIKFTQHDMLQ